MQIKNKNKIYSLKNIYHMLYKNAKSKNLLLIVLKIF